MFNYQRFYFFNRKYTTFLLFIHYLYKFFYCLLYTLTNLQIGKSTNKKSRYFPATTFPH